MLPDIPDFMVRVNLPSSGAYHCSPSGDSEYDDAYNQALMKVVPPGFEVVRIHVVVARQRREFTVLVALRDGFGPAAWHHLQVQ